MLVRNLQPGIIAGSFSSKSGLKKCCGIQVNPSTYLCWTLDPCSSIIERVLRSNIHSTIIPSSCRDYIFEHCYMFSGYLPSESGKVWTFWTSPWLLEFLAMVFHICIPSVGLIVGQRGVFSSLLKLGPPVPPAERLKRPMWGAKRTFCWNQVNSIALVAHSIVYDVLFMTMNQQFLWV